MTFWLGLIIDSALTVFSKENKDANIILIMRPTCRHVILSLLKKLGQELGSRLLVVDSHIY